MMNIENVLKSHGIGTGGGSTIKSIQRGYVSMNSSQKNVTISAINPLTSIIRCTYHVPTGRAVYYPRNTLIKATILSATSIQFGLHQYNDLIICEWEVIEFNNVKSLQHGVITELPVESTYNSCYQNEVSISVVNTQKAILFYSFSLNTEPNARQFISYIISTNKITFRGVEALTGLLSLQWYLIEFN